MAGPENIPKGSWGPELDGSAAAGRRQFEASLAQQQQKLDELAQQHAAAGPPQPRSVQVIDQMPDEYPIPPAGGGQDMMAALGADQDRADREHRQAAAASGEGPAFIDDAPVPQPPGKAAPTGHIPQSLRRQLAAEQAFSPPRPRAAPVPTPQGGGAAALRQRHAPAPQSSVFNPTATISHMIGMRLAILDDEHGTLKLDDMLEMLSGAAEVQFAIAAWLKR